jgi:hypothetical protein
VSAVSSRSTTIGGPGQTITASVTGSTRVTGQVWSINGINVGDQVSAEIMLRGGKDAAVAIQYPPRSPLGTSAP